MSVPQITLEKFECEGEPSSVSIRWEKWKRSFRIFLLASDIKDNIKQKACLLHFGGSELQEIFYNIPDADENSDDISFDDAIKKLDDYFAPKQSKVYERHLFRLLKQEPQEKFEKFLVRLRQQAKKCDFSLTDENLIDQITEKCSSDELRKKILKHGDAITLDDVIKEANALEVVNRQLGNFNGITSSQAEPQGVYRITSKFNSEMKENQTQASGCSRCGSWKHISRNSICPAMGKSCLKCGAIGHFRRQCRTKKRSIEATNEARKEGKEKHDSETKKFKRINNVSELREIASTSKINDYIFYINNFTNNITCKIAGVDINMSIDSGCKDNLITDKTWKTMKENNAVVTNQDAHPQKRFLPYGCDEPLTLLGSFQADLQVGDRLENAKFYVVKGGTRDLLGQETATSLGVLKINVDVNSVACKAFPKF